MQGTDPLVPVAGVVMTDMLEFALRYARDLHFMVVPVNPATNGALPLNWTNDPKKLFTPQHQDRPARIPRPA